jgi:hypothetical protein
LKRRISASSASPTLATPAQRLTGGTAADAVVCALMRFPQSSSLFVILHLAPGNCEIIVRCALLQPIIPQQMSKIPQPGLEVKI